MQSIPASKNLAEFQEKAGQFNSVIRLPELEILVPTMPIKSHIRNGDFFKIISTMETGAEHGMWTFTRYQNWMENRKTWFVPDETETAETEPAAEPLPTERLPQPARPKSPASPTTPAKVAPAPPGRAIEIEPVEGGLDELLKKLE